MAGLQGVAAWDAVKSPLTRPVLQLLIDHREKLDGLLENHGYERLADCATPQDAAHKLKRVFEKNDSVDGCQEFVDLLKRTARSVENPSEREVLQTAAKDAEEELRNFRSNRNCQASQLHRWIYSATDCGEPREAGRERVVVNDTVQREQEREFSPFLGNLSAQRTSSPPVVCMLGCPVSTSRAIRALQRDAVQAVGWGRSKAIDDQLDLVQYTQRDTLWLQDLRSSADAQCGEAENKELVLLPLTLKTGHPIPAPVQQQGVPVSSSADDCATDPFLRQCQIVRCAVEASNHSLCFFSKQQTEEMLRDHSELSGGQSSNIANYQLGQGQHPTEAVAWTRSLDGASSRRDAAGNAPSWSYHLLLIRECLRRFPRSGPLITCSEPLKLTCVFDVSAEYFEANEKKLQGCVRYLFPRPGFSMDYSQTTQTPFVNVESEDCYYCLSHFLVEQCTSYSHWQLDKPTSEHWIHAAAGIIPERLLTVTSKAEVVLAPNYSHGQSSDVHGNGLDAPIPTMSDVFPERHLGRLDRLLRNSNVRARCVFCLDETGGRQASQFCNELGCVAMLPHSTAVMEDQQQDLWYCCQFSPDGGTLNIYLNATCSGEAGHAGQAGGLFPSVVHTIALGLSEVAVMLPTSGTALEELVAERCSELAKFDELEDQFSECRLLVVRSKAQEGVQHGDGSPAESTEADPPAFLLFGKDEAMAHAAWNQANMGSPGSSPPTGAWEEEPEENDLFPDVAHDNGQAVGGGRGESRSDDIHGAGMGGQSSGADDSNPGHNADCHRVSTGEDLGNDWHRLSPPLQQTAGHGRSRQESLSLRSAEEAMLHLLQHTQTRCPAWSDGVLFVNCLKLIAARLSRTWLTSRSSLGNSLVLHDALRERHEDLLDGLEQLIQTGQTFGDAGSSSRGLPPTEPVLCVPCEKDGQTWRPMPLSKDQRKRLATEARRCFAETPAKTEMGFKVECSDHLLRGVKERWEVVNKYVQALGGEKPGACIELTRLRSRAQRRLDILSDGLELCYRECQSGMPCLLPRGHVEDHDAVVVDGNQRRCSLPCKFCLKENPGLVDAYVNGTSSHHRSCCKKGAGHQFLSPTSEDEQLHVCVDGEDLHRCDNKRRCCVLSGGRQCDRKCKLWEGHDEDDCLCRTPVKEHLCPGVCRLFGREHCQKDCAEQYGLDTECKQHDCGSKHRCKRPCDVPGLCYLLGEVAEERKAVEIDASAPHRYKCEIILEPHEMSCPEGRHQCAPAGEEVPTHFCNRSCRLCGSYCDLEAGHSAGACRTTHGPIKQTVQLIDINGKSVPVAVGSVCCEDICGRGGPSHTHVCSGRDGALLSTSRKERAVSGSYEVAHAPFWSDYMNFQDTSKGDIDSFDRCRFVCRVPELTEAAEDHFKACHEDRRCLGRMFHEAEPSSEFIFPENGYRTDEHTGEADGVVHYLNCDHHCWKDCGQNSTVTNKDDPSYHSRLCRETLGHHGKCDCGEDHSTCPADCSAAREGTETCVNNFKCIHPIGKGHEDEKGVFRKHSCSEDPPQPCQEYCAWPHYPPKPRRKCIGESHTHLEPDENHVCKTCHSNTRIGTRCRKCNEKFPIRVNPNTACPCSQPEDPDHPGHCLLFYDEDPPPSQRSRKVDSVVERRRLSESGNTESMFQQRHEEKQDQPSPVRSRIHTPDPPDDSPITAEVALETDHDASQGGLALATASVDAEPNSRDKRVGALSHGGDEEGAGSTTPPNDMASLTADTEVVTEPKHVEFNGTGMPASNDGNRMLDVLERTEPGDGEQPPAVSFATPGDPTTPRTALSEMGSSEDSNQDVQAIGATQLVAQRAFDGEDGDDVGGQHPLKRQEAQQSGNGRIWQLESRHVSTERSFEDDFVPHGSSLPSRNRPEFATLFSSCAASSDSRHVSTERSFEDDFVPHGSSLPPRNRPEFPTLYSSSAASSGDPPQTPELVKSGAPVCKAETVVDPKSPIQAPKRTPFFRLKQTPKKPSNPTPPAPPTPTGRDAPGVAEFDPLSPTK